jgi:hypothetical protein
MILKIILEGKIVNVFTIIEVHYEIDKIFYAYTPHGYCLFMDWQTGEMYYEPTEPVLLTHFQIEQNEIEQKHKLRRHKDLFARDPLEPGTPFVFNDIWTEIIVETEMGNIIYQFKNPKPSIEKSIKRRKLNK